jgi:DNA (cytosine-5)-methyltransferase 1
LTGPTQGRVAELFAGVGGFRLGLEGKPGSRRAKSAPWQVVWSNQWEPGAKTQHASDCYVRHFGPAGHISEDIAVVLDEIESGTRKKPPKLDLVVGGFPCQDYSVARVLTQAAGIEGKKGVLWWEIRRFLELTKPKYIFLENVDRLLKSPADQRGRDFGVMLHCLWKLGYYVEWRVVNAADYGYPQRRRRTFIVGERIGARRPPFSDAIEWLRREGVLASALPADIAAPGGQLSLLLPTPTPTFTLPEDLVDLSERFSADFQNAGVMHGGRVWTLRVESRYSGPRKVLGDCLQDDKLAPAEFFVPLAQLKQWQYLKGAKREERTVARNGFTYFYTEGAVQFPDRRDEPSRTILTGEGGSSPSRFKHVIKTKNGRRYRRLTPIELERLDGFPGNWTNTGMPDTRRAFCMGNALVVGLIERIGDELARRHAGRSAQAISKAV